MSRNAEGLALVFDCGATNLRVMAMDAGGNVLAAKVFPNSTTEDPFWNGGRIWDLDQLWQKFCAASIEVMAKVKGHRLVGLTVTTFGVDGTFVDEQGQTLYPVISWQCPRLSVYMDGIHRYLPVAELYRISGVYPHAFNTIAKMAWFKEERPDVLEKAHRFLFLPSLLLQKMGAAAVNDVTMMGTSMMADLKERRFSKEILDSLDLPGSLWASPAEPGTQVGQVGTKAAVETGIPEGLPVFLGGHDTQFAVFGSGARLHQPVLSSGTWEILMVRSSSFSATSHEMSQGLTTEADACPGIYNIGQNWLGSGVLEWFSKHFYPGMQGDVLYQTMIAEAEALDSKSLELLVNPEFLLDGHTRGGTIHGLSIHTSRAEIYRALLEGLAYRLREALEVLQNAGNFRAEEIVCVGGGAKNKLWNQIRADVCGLPLRLIKQKETTVLGAALFVFYGAGLYASPEEARAAVDFEPELVQPGTEAAIHYSDGYHRYAALRKHLFTTRS